MSSRLLRLNGIHLNQRWRHVISTSRHLSSTSSSSHFLLSALKTGATLQPSPLAIIDTTLPGGDPTMGKGLRLSFADLDTASDNLAATILLQEQQQNLSSQEKNKKKTAIGAFHQPGAPFLTTLVAAWKLHRPFVPLAATHSIKELNYVLEDSQVGTIVLPSTTNVTSETLEHLDAMICQLNPSNSVFSSLLSSSSSTTDLSESGGLSPLYTSSASSSEEFTRLLKMIQSKDMPSDDTTAVILYTSGTTGAPKGVVHTHSTISAMVKSLREAWEVVSTDHLLHCLPLYHMHGLLCKALTPLSMLGSMEFLPSASPKLLWERLSNESKILKENQKESVKPLTLFMAVPTVYARLLETSNEPQLLLESLQEKKGSIQEIEKAKELISARQNAIDTLRSLRFTAAGSAALPDVVMDRWETLTGQRMLERYGMTEIGMALSNPLHGARNPGSVGQPLPGVRCRLVADDGSVVMTPNTPGELLIAGPNVFKEYLNKPIATESSFLITNDSLPDVGLITASGELTNENSPPINSSEPTRWFRTGDVAEFTNDGYWKILGRMSADIIKSGGFKLSALEIEREILSHPQISEAAVIGIPDERFGEKIIAVLGIRPNIAPEVLEELKSTGQLLPSPSPSPKNRSLEEAKLSEKAMSQFLADRLAKYKMPREYILLDVIPRNQIGKVAKKTLLKDIEKL